MPIPMGARTYRTLNINPDCPSTIVNLGHAPQAWLKRPGAMLDNLRSRVSGWHLVAICLSAALLWVWGTFVLLEISYGGLNKFPLLLIQDHQFGLRSEATTSILDGSSIWWSSGSPETEIPSSETPTNQTDRPLVTYVYSESAESRRNLEFFIAHGLHAQADFVFIFNGETDADLLLPEAPEIRAVHRNNTCYDLGSHGEILAADGLWMQYRRFILMNASVRGPFLPTWADSLCWTDRLLSKITDDVKVRTALWPPGPAFPLIPLVE